MHGCGVAEGFPGDIKFALIDGAPEPICQKMLEGREDWPIVEESWGGLRTDCRAAEIPCKPVRQEF